MNKEEEHQETKETSIDNTQHLPTFSSPTPQTPISQNRQPESTDTKSQDANDKSDPQIPNINPTTPEKTINSNQPQNETENAQKTQKSNFDEIITFEKSQMRSKSEITQNITLQDINDNSQMRKIKTEPEIFEKLALEEKNKTENIEHRLGHDNYDYHHHHHKKSKYDKYLIVPRFLGRCLTCLGVVYGDLGTSVIYTQSSIFDYNPNWIDLLGSTSIIIYTILLIVLIKYIIIVLRFDHKGEGGISMLSASLMSLQWKNQTLNFFKKWILIFIAIIGTSFILSDGVITPCIEILSAIQGLEIYSPSLKPAVVPITCILLAFIFLIQPFGTAKVVFFNYLKRGFYLVLLCFYF